LSLHGKVVLKDGSEIEISIGESDGDPQFCVTDLLIHAAKEQMEKNAAKLILGEELNILIGSTPYGDENASELVKLNVLNILNEKYGIIEEDFLSAEIEAVPAHKATDVGLDRSMVGAYGQDDRVCAYASLEAIFGCDKPETTSIVVMTDKEEIGSEGNTGLNSDYLRYFISDLARSEGLCHEHVLSASSCLSADVTAAFDPTWSSAYEKNNASFINYGVSICKYTGSGGKAGASDCSAEFLGKIRKLLNDNNIPWQVSEITKVDGGGGGTVSKFVAGMNIDVLDMGVAVLSMHSPFELVSKIDVYLLYKTFLKFFK
jgi:aspartyl aminopeptidase